MRPCQSSVLVSAASRLGIQHQQWPDAPGRGWVHIVEPTWSFHSCHEPTEEALGGWEKGWLTSTEWTLLSSWLLRGSSLDAPCSTDTAQCPQGEVHLQTSSSDSLVANRPILPLVTHELWKSPQFSPPDKVDNCYVGLKRTSLTTILRGAILFQQSKSNQCLQIARDHLWTWPKCCLPLSTVNCKRTLVWAARDSKGSKRRRYGNLSYLIVLILLSGLPWPRSGIHYLQCMTDCRCAFPTLCPSGSVY